MLGVARFDPCHFLSAHTSEVDYQTVDVTLLSESEDSIVNGLVVSYIVESVGVLDVFSGEDDQAYVVVRADSIYDALNVFLGEIGDYLLDHKSYDLFFTFSFSHTIRLLSKSQSFDIRFGR